MQTLVHTQFSVFISISHEVCGGTWSYRWSISSCALPVSVGSVEDNFLCPCLFSFSFHSEGKNFTSWRSCTWWNLFTSQPLDRGKPMTTSLSSYRHGSRMKPAVWPTSCLPICNCPQSHFRSDKQGLFHLKLISLTSFPHISTSQRFLLMWHNCFTVKRCFLFLPGTFQCKDSTCDVRRWEMCSDPLTTKFYFYQKNIL